MNKIYDIDGEQISCVFNFEFAFIKPFIIVDALRDKERPPKIGTFTDITKLKEIEFTLYSKNLTKKKVWVKRQKIALYVRPIEDVAEKGFKKTIKLPPNHYFEIDTANHKIRIVGAFAHRSGYGDWIYY